MLGQSRRFILGFMKSLLALLVLLTAPAPAQDVAQEVLTLTNQARQQAGLRPLVLDARLSQAAQQHSLEMDRLHYFGHASPLPEFATLSRRIQEVGCYGLSSAENLHREQGYAPRLAAANAVKAWLHSPQHRRNLLNPKFNRMGLGISRVGDQCTLTQDLAYSAIEVLQQQRCGKRLSLYCQVNDGPLHGAVLFQGKRCANWSADMAGKFQVEIELPAAGTLALGQAVGEREWVIETEWMVAGSKP